MANTHWLAQFPTAETEFLAFQGSDHRPLVTSISRVQSSSFGQFRYDKRLFQSEEFRDVVVEAWNHSPLNRSSLNSKLVHCRRVMAKWKREHRVNAAVRITQLKKELDEALSSGSVSTIAINRIKQDLNQAYLDEEHYWKLKSRIEWLKHGDRNTKYFYAKTKTRLARNRIMAIEADDGSIKRGDDAIGLEAQKYFVSLFKSTRLPQESYSDVFQDFQPRVTEAINRDLTRPVSDTEIKDAVFDIGPDRAPGPDGITGSFYHQFWPEIQASVTEEIRLHHTT